MNWDFLGFLATAVSIGVAVTIPFGLFTLYRALGRRFERGATPGVGEVAQLRERLDEVERTLAAMDQPGDRLVELEERMDVAERVLSADRREMDRLRGAS